MTLHSSDQSKPTASAVLFSKLFVSTSPASTPPISTTDLVIGLNILLVSICAKTEWEYGESWIPNADRSVLELSPAWCVNTNLDMRRAIPWMQFQVCSKSFILRSTEGMPGRVWQSQKPEWIEDVSAQPEAYFSRDKIAKALGVKAGFGVPIVVGTQLVAVVGLFMSKARSLDLLLIEETQAIVRHFQYELSTQVTHWSS